MMQLQRFDCCLVTLTEHKLYFENIYRTTQLLFKLCKADLMPSWHVFHFELDCMKTLNGYVYAGVTYECFIACFTNMCPVC